MAKNLFLTINENVVKQLKESAEINVDVKKISYQHIEITTPNFLTTIESMLDARPEVRNDPKEMQYLEFFMSLPYKVVIDKLSVDTVKISTTIMSPKKMLKSVEFTVNTTEKPIYEVSYLASSELGDGTDLAEATLQFIGKLLNHLDKPTTVKEIHSVKELKTSSKKKKKAGKKKSPIQYVYKTVCKVTNIQPEKSAARRPYSEREWNKEEWTRRGHYRIYRDKNTGEIKKRVWINSTTCHARGKIKTNQHMKITRID